MSWMDSWSRPTKHAATPPPLYLTSGIEAIPYCHTCGRVISTRKSQTTKVASTPVKYCSDRCRHNKPSDAPGSVDRRITDGFIALLNGESPSLNLSNDLIASAKPHPPKTNKANSKKIKGETRITVSCAEVEELIFGTKIDPEKAFGRKKNRARRGVPDAKEWKTVDMEDKDDDDADTPPADPSISSESEPETNPDELPNMINLRIRPPQSQSDVNGSVGGEKGWAEKIEETPAMLQKRLEGQKRAEERELVRCAARRLCAFGVKVDASAEEEEAKDRERVKTKAKGKGRGKGRAKGEDDADGDGDGGGERKRRKMCEAMMSGNVVEASYAKGEWGIRWRE